MRKSVGNRKIIMSNFDAGGGKIGLERVNIGKDELMGERNKKG
jgi:hypothetical protein